MKYAILSLRCAVALVALTSMAGAHDALLSANEAASVPDAANVDFRWDQKIPLRDGVRLSATVYTPRNQKAPAPCLFTLTPYIGQSYHDRGIYFAAHGDSEDLTDQRADYARRGKLLVYHSAPFEKDTEISGFFKLSAWIGIDQPDTDFTHPSALYVPLGQP